MTRRAAVTLSALLVTAVAAREPVPPPRPTPVWTVVVAGNERWTKVCWAGFSPDGQRLTTRTLVPKPPAPADGVIAPQQIPRGSRLLAWEVGGWREVYRLDTGDGQDDAPGPTASYAPDGTVLVAEGGKLVHRGTDGRPAGGSWGRADGVWLAGPKAFFAVTADPPGNYHLYRGGLPEALIPGQPGRPLPGSGPTVPARLTPVGDGRRVTVLAVSPDGSRVAQAEVGERPPAFETSGFLSLNRARVVEQKFHSPRLELARLAGGVDAGEVLALAFAPGGRFLASGSADGSVRLWAVPPGDEGLTPRATVRPPPKPGQGQREVSCLAFRPDGQVLAVGTGDRDEANVILAEVPSGRVLQGVMAGGPRHTVTAVGFSPDGRRLVTGTSLGAVQVWDVDALLPRQ